jgi:FAD/FMN-containing dehydrogenase
MLRTAVPPLRSVVDAMLTSNRALYEQARDLGGKQYPVGAIPFRRSDWRDHFGDEWHRLVAAKRRYDPNGILTPGQGIPRRQGEYRLAAIRPERMSKFRGSRAR